MDAFDPFDTQHDADPSVIEELRANGFDDAREIGRGGFGVVYRCAELALDRAVAVKVLGRGLADEYRERFLREQHAMSRLTAHQNIVTVLQVGFTPTERPFIVMPYLARGSLDARIRQSGPLPVEETLELGLKLVGALEAVHGKGILHRDVKPANILLTEHDEPALMDFGVARISGGFETIAGVLTGSPTYTAPEILSGAAPSPASDVYGLGATLLFALTGAAFECRSGEQLISQFIRIMREPAPGLRDQDVPNEVVALIENAMSSRPEDRQPSAHALGENIRDIQNRRAPRHRGRPRRDEAPSEPPPPQHELPTQSHHQESGNLPSELSSFIGRRQELTEAKKLLESSRLLTFAGIGGVGKTRLALRLAKSIRRTFPDGAWLIELDEVDSPSRLIDVVAATLGVRDKTDRALRNVLVDFLSTRKLLLVFDNCEQALDAVADLVMNLLQKNADLRILVTSREPLAIAGEVTLRVPPLSVPGPDGASSLKGLSSYDSVLLFTARATTAVATFSLNDANKSAVAQICHRLDGLPLPIELAAARLRAMSPEQILQRLSDRYAVLTRGGRGVPPRQHTLRLCVDWSYDLCTPLERRMWERLSVFTGSFDLDAAEVVCGEDIESEAFLDAAASLVDKSVLIREEHSGAVRFRQLETLRAYGREKGEQNSDYHDLRRRHRDWYRQLAHTAEAEFVSARQLDWIAKFGDDQPNLRDAMDFCVSECDSESGLQIATPLMLLWGSRGQLSEVRHWLDRFLSLEKVPPSTDTLRALYANCLMAEQQLDHERGATLLEQARDLALKIDDPIGKAIADHADGIVGLFTGDFGRAIASLGRAYPVLEGSPNDLSLELESLTLLGLSYQLFGTEPSLAIECYEKVLAISNVHGEYAYRIYALAAMASARWRQRDEPSAAKLLAQGLQLAKAVSDPVGCAHCLEVLAWITSSSAPERATTLLGAAYNLGRAAGDTSVFVPGLISYHEDCERAARRLLSDHVFEKSWEQGKSMDLTEAAAYALGERAPTLNPHAPDLLTKREHQVAELISEGLTNKAIAARLVIAPRTAQGHVEHILTKLGFTSRTQVAAWIAESRRSL